MYHTCYCKKNLKDIHIGSLIEKRLSQTGMTYAEFARQLCCDRTTIYSIVRSKSIDIERLIRISQILDYDFIGNVYKNDGAVKIQITLSEDEIKRLQSNETSELNIVIKPPCTE